MRAPNPESARAPEGRPSGPFYGWIVVGVAFLVQFMFTGFVFYSFAVILTHLADEFSGGDRTPILALQLGMGVAGIVMAPFIGRLAGRGWIRVLMTGGTLAAGVGMILVAHLHSLWWIGVVFATLLSLGGNTMGGVTPTTLIVHWFEKRRAIALGASQLGASLGGMVMAPVAAGLVSAYGWRGAWEILGIVILCTAPLVWWLTVDRPEDRGLRPDGDSARELEPSAAADSGPISVSARPVVLRTSRALREANLWLIALATGISFMGTGALLNHIVAFGTDSGFSAERAALLASLVAGGAGLGKLVWGWLYDRLGEAQSLFASIIFQGVCLLGLTWVAGYYPLATLSLLTGIAIGGILPLSSALMARGLRPGALRRDAGTDVADRHPATARRPNPGRLDPRHQQQLRRRLPAVRGPAAAGARPGPRRAPAGQAAERNLRLTRNRSLSVSPGAGAVRFSPPGRCPAKRARGSVRTASGSCRTARCRPRPGRSRRPAPSASSPGAARRARGTRP